MKRFLIFVLISSAIYTGCGDTQPYKGKSNDHQHDERSSDIELNNGEKWRINDEMTIPIKNMGNHLSEYKSDGGGDYASLAEVLQADIKLLLSSCTMTGKSHDELHKWLLPYMELVNELSEAKNETEAAEIVENIENSMLTYNKYFQ